MPFSGASQNPAAGSGNCLSFDGVDDFISVTGGAAHNYSLPITISAWVKIDPSATGEIPIFSSNDQSGTNAGLHFWLTDTSINAGYSNGSTGPFLANTFYRQYIANNFSGMWINVAAVINTNSISLFLNGVQLGGQLYNSNVSYSPVNTGNSVIGKKTNGSTTHYFKGQIDEVSLWDGAQTPVDIRNNMCRKLSPVPFNVFRYFKLDVLNGTSIVDDSQTGTNAQINSSPTLVKSGAAIEPAKLNITVVQAISAGDRMDYTVQKSAEMGVVKLIPVFSTYCSHKIPANKIDKKRAHWQAIANSACEQSGRCDLVHIATPCLLEDAIKTHGHNGLYLEPTARNKIINLPDDLKTDLSVFIGPEGGFSDIEIASFESAGMFGTQLGQRILRTETAAPVILAAVHTLFGDFS